MIQIAVVGSTSAAFHAAKKGFAVFGIEPELESHAAKAGGLFILFGVEETKLNIKFRDKVDAASKMIESADIVIIGKGQNAKFVKQMCDLKGIKYVEGTGEDVVEKAKERLVRFNLFGTKK
ncbi:MAG: hypothetical protein GOV01_00215 [Candidatus Altiarchaeota archaeon]|nr:hypothetical protein [Candidatus Altiarchaeota archaeon]